MHRSQEIYTGGITTRQADKILLMVICVVTFFINNDVFIPDIMESRNIVTAKEMVEDGHWIVPTMNGDLRLEKPPLPTWITATGFMIAGENLAFLRAFGGVMGCLLAYFFYRFVSRVVRRDPVVPTLLLLTCYNVVLMGRTASWDIYCHAFMMGAICWIAEALINRGSQWWKFTGAGLMLGLSFMSKGPVSFYGLFLPFIFTFVFLYKPSMRGKGWPLVWMTLLALAVAFWWYAWVYAFHADELASVVEKESGNWVNYNVRPWWYYWKFFLESGIWSLLLLTAIVYPLFKWNKALQTPFLLGLGWMFLSLILLSCLPEKKPRYLLPLLIPASLLMGELVAGWVKDVKKHRLCMKDRVLYVVNAVVIVIVTLALPVLSYVFLYMNGDMSLWTWVAVCACSLVCAAYMVNGITRIRPKHLVWGVAFLFCSIEIFALPSAKYLINNREMYSIRHTRDNQQLAGIPFYYVPNAEGISPRIELVYAAGRKIRPLPVTSDPKTDIKTMQRLAPFAVLSHEGVGKELPADTWRYFDTVPMGVYDDNRRPKGTKRYSPEFVYRLTLIKNKK